MESDLTVNDRVSVSKEGTLVTECQASSPNPEKRATKRASFSER